MKSIHVFLQAFGLGLLLCTFVHTASAEGFAVIVNSGNGYDASNVDGAKQDVRRYFLKDKRSWPGGEDAKPYFRSPDSAEQQALSEVVLELSESKLTQHWLKKKQTSGETPPKAVSSDRALLRLVGKNPGGISVVNAEAAAGLPPEVKVLFTF